MVLILGVAPTVGAQSDAGPDASTWVQTESMGAWVILKVTVFGRRLD